MIDGHALGKQDKYFIQTINRSISASLVGIHDINPVFKIPDEKSIGKIRNEIRNIFAENIRSTGNYIYLVDRWNGSLDRDDVEMIACIEDWRQGCVPKRLHGKPNDRRRYINDRENEIKSNVKSEFPKNVNINITLDRHVNRGGVFGQYQLIAISE